MELLQLRYFLESAKSESFAKTAEDYLVPATSVSASVKRLEEELGCKLFDRSSNRIRLNENGRLLEKSLRLSLGELDRAVGELKSRREEERKIRLLVRSMRRDVTELVVSYRRLHPEVKFKTVFDFSARDLREYDLIIDEKKNLYRDYEGFELYNLGLRLKCSASSPLCGRSILLSSLSDFPFVSMGEEGNMHRILFQACERAGFVPDFSVVTNDIECFETMVASGMGIGIGREKTKEGTEEGICDLSVEDFCERYSVWAYYRREECFGPLADFLEFLKQEKL